jgi:DNA-binding NarL/FixJ family response regulator
VTLHRVLVHVVAEINRHLGHADIVRELIDGAIGATSDIAVVGTVDARDQVASSLERTKPDVLIIRGRGEADSAEIEALLYAQPRLRLVTIGDAGRSSALHALRPITIPLGDVAPEALLDAIRASAQGVV